jgi:hypothetical protein
MSNRFHSKFHRSNHHTYGIEVNPDTGHDPIASRDLPFRGDFILKGALSAMARLSAYAGYFYSDNTALCAWAGHRGAYIFAKDQLGLEVQSADYTAISARAHNIGVETLSDRIALSAYGFDYGIITGSKNIALSANGINIGIDAFSPNFAISAFGQVRGMDVASNDVALSAYGFNKAGVFASPHFALSAYGFDRGIDVASNNVGISSWGGNAAGIFISDVVALSTNSFNLDGYPIRTNPYFGPNYKSKNVLNNRTGIFTENPLSAFHVTGGSLFDGHVTVTGNLSVAGDLSRFDTYVFITSSTQIMVNSTSNTEPALYISNIGNNRIIECYDADTSVTVPAFMVDGTTSRPGNVGINVTDANEKLTILGNISAQGNLSATYIHVTPFLGTYTALPNTRAAFTSYDNSYAQVNHQNLFTGNNASSDFIATTDTGTDSTGYIDLGINNSTYSQTSFTIVGASDGYLYTQGGHLGVGTGAAKNLVFFTNGTLAANERMRINSSGDINIGDTISGAGTATLKVKGQTDINISGSATTNIATTLNTGALTIGNSTGALSALGSTIYLNKDAGANITNIGNGTTTGAVSIGNSTGTLTVNGNAGNITTAGTLSINTTTGRATNINNGTAATTNINTGTNAVTTTIGNAGTVAVNGSVAINLTGPTNINSTGSSNTQIGNTATNVGIGISPSVKLDVSNNDTVPAAATGTVLHVTQSDTTNARVLVDSFGVSGNARPAFTGRAAGGTAASPSAVASDAVLCEFTGQGYGTDSYSTTSRGRVTIKAAEAWTNSAQGTYVGFEATAAGGTTTTQIATIKSTGLDVSTGQITHLGNPTGAIPVLTKTTGVDFKAALNTLTTLYTVPAGYRFVPTSVGVIHDTVVFSNLATNSTTVTDTMPLFKLVNSNGSSIFGSNGGWFAPAQNYFSGSLTSQGSHDVYSTVSGPKAGVASNDNVKFKIDTAWASAGVGTHFTTWSGTVILQGFLVAN